MAIDTTIAALTGAPALGPKIQVLQRTINFKTVALGGTGNLAADAWYAIFQPEAGDVVIASAITIETVDAGGGTLQIGVGGDTSICAAKALGSATTLASAVTTPIAVNATPITLCAKTAAITTAKVHVTVAIMKAASFAG